MSKWVQSAQNRVWLVTKPKMSVLLSLSEKAMAPHSCTLAWKIPWTEETGGLQSMGSLSRTRLRDFTFTLLLSWIGEGNGNPLQCSCLENSRGGEAWWAAVYGVAQSRIRLKRLSSSSSSSSSYRCCCCCCYCFDSYYICYYFSLLDK